ncbi:MAG: Efflux pump membrane transporter BepE [Holosporales bacterium]
MGRFTQFFVESPLTLLILIATFFLGVLALINLPREEEPQISVPMVDVFVQAQGLKAQDAAELVTKPLEVILKGIHGVDHIYSQTQDDGAVITVRFQVGYNPDKAILHVHERIRAHLDEMPYGIQMPLVNLKTIDDVAILVINLMAKPELADRYLDTTLYEIGEQLRQEMMTLSDVGSTYIVGGRPSQIRIEPNLDQLLKLEVTLLDVVNKIKNANLINPLGRIYKEQKTFSLTAGDAFKTLDDLKEFVISNDHDKTFYLKDIANITIDGKNTVSRAWYYDKDSDHFLPTVAIALAKKPGANAVLISNQVQNKLASLHGTLIPKDINAKITRDYGQTANEKSNRLLADLLGATLCVVLLVGIFIGWRESVVVLFVVPLTILGTLFFAWLMGYTINRVSLFALIFSIGILVDDAIVFIENIVRHWREFPHENKIKTAVNAVVEVGKPTIVATFTIIVALLPMLFVSGLMGPYMSPIPINASVAMLLSLVVAFVIVPWFLLKVKGNTPILHHTQESVLSKYYHQFATRLVYDRPLCKKFMMSIVVATGLSCCLFITKTVTVKMLPFDNKSELVIQMDLPKNASLEETDKYLKMINHSLKSIPEVTDTQLYVGTGAPFNFNGLVRHTYLRNQPYMGEIQVNLSPKKDRSRTSHEIALHIRSNINALSYPPTSVVKVLEVPPGPPVLSTLLAEVYGPTAQKRREAAQKLSKIYHDVSFITDIDDSFGSVFQKKRLTLLKDRMDAYKADEASIYQTLNVLMGDTVVGYIHHSNGRYPTQISLTLSNKNKRIDDDILSVFVPTKTGLVALSNMIELTAEDASYPIFRHNGFDVEMVMGELAGAYEAPIYGMFAVNDKLQESDLKDAQIRYHGQPTTQDQISILWDGEWEITYVTFADMGKAFMVALLAIYAILVAQFKNFRTPLVILVPIPLVLVGIILGHALFKAAFTATSMIGLIALAGIVVRNSLLLVEFIKHRQHLGDPLQKALIEAGSTRITPIFMTAVAAMIGAVFMFFDPIFQGLAISLFFGLLSSTFLTLFSIPAIYIIAKTK